MADNVAQRVAGLVHEGTGAFKKAYFEPAVSYFTEALALSDKYNPELIYNARSLAYLRMKKFQESLDDAEMAIKFKLSWSKGYLRKGQALMGLEKYEEALMALMEGFDKDPYDNVLKKTINECRAKIQGPKADLRPMVSPFADLKLWEKIEKNPITRQYLLQPDFREIIQHLQKNPQDLGKHLGDARIMTTVGMLLEVDIEAPLEASGSSMASGMPHELMASAASGGGQVPANFLADLLRRQVRKQQTTTGPTVTELPDDYDIRSGPQITELPDDYEEAEEEKPQGGKKRRRKKRGKKGGVSGGDPQQHEKQEEASGKEEIEKGASGCTSSLKGHMASEDIQDQQETQDQQGKAQGLQGEAKGKKEHAQGHQGNAKEKRAHGEMGKAQVEHGSAGGQSESDLSLVQEAEMQGEKGREEGEEKRGPEVAKPVEDVKAEGKPKGDEKVHVPDPKALKEKDLGNAAYKKREFDTAVEHYDKAIELDPINIAIRTNKAAVFFEQHKYDECIEECQKAVDIGRENRADFKLIAKAFARMGNAYVKKDDLDNGLKFYEKSLSEHRVQDIVKKATELKKKIAEKERLSYIDPEKALEEKKKGNECFTKGDYPSAIKYYSEAIKRNPEDAKIYSNRAACYTKLAEFNMSLKDSDECIRLDPTFVKGYLRKAGSYMAMKDISKAKATYQKAMELDPNCQEAIDGYRKCSYQENDPEAVQKRVMNDPEIRQILQDPGMQSILSQMQQDPNAVREHLKDPVIAEKIQKLIDSGLIGMRPM